MKIEIRPVYYLTLLLLLGAVSGCSKSARSTRAVSKGDREFAAGRYERAEILYQQALQLGGQDSEALPNVYLKLGRVYHAQGRWLEAMGHLNKGLERRTNDIPSKAILGESLFFTGMLPNAFQVSAELLQVQPGHPGAMVMLVDSAGVDSNNLAQATFILGNQSETAKKTAAYLTAQGTLLLRARDLNSAEKEYLAALGVDPQFYRAHLGLANVHTARRDPEKAKTAILSAMAAMPNRSGAISACLGTLDFLGDREEAKRVARDLVQKNPDFLPPYFFLANSALKEGLHDDSLAYVQKALVKAPANFVALSSCGDVYLARNDGTNALRYYQQAASVLKMVPPPLLMKMGYAFFANSDLPNAKARFREALDASTNIYPEAALALSDLVNKQKDAHTARGLTPKLVKLTEQEPGMLGGYLMLANLYLTQSEPNSAIKVMQDAQKRFTNVAQLPYLAGGIYKGLGQKTDARKAFEQALVLAPQNVMFLSAVVDLDVEDNLYTNAYNRISKCLTNSPDSAPLHYLRGRVYWREAQTSEGTAGAGQKEEKINGAIDSFTKAIQLGPTNQESYYSLAEVYTETGRHKEALAKLQDYLSNTKVGAGTVISNAPGAYLLAAQIYERSGDYTNAEGYYGKIVAMNQRNLINLIALNNLACLYNDHLDNVKEAYRLAEEAYRLAQSAREMAPRVPSIAETLGWVVFNKDDYARALTLLREAAVDPTLAEKPDYLYHVGMANYMLGAEEDAREAFQKALAAADGKTNTVKMSSSSKAATGPTPSWAKDAKSKLSNLSLDATTADPRLEKELKTGLTATPNDPILLKRLGMVQERREDYTNALQSYEAALKSNPKHIDLRLRIALLYAGPMNDLPRGLALAKKVKDDAPNDPKAALVVGQLAYRSGEYRLAVALLEESAGSYPDDVVLSYYLGAARYSIGRVLDAEQPMRKAAESGVKAPQVAEAKQFLSFMTATSDPSKNSAVVESARATLKNGSNNLPAMMLVAVDNESREYQEAVKMYSRILKDYPLFHPATRNLGLLHCQRREYALAVPLLQSTAGGEAADPKVLFYLGTAQFNLQRTNDAQRSLNRAKGGLPKDMEQECQNMLKMLDSSK